MDKENNLLSKEIEEENKLIKELEIEIVKIDNRINIKSIDIDKSIVTITVDNISTIVKIDKEEVIESEVVDRIQEVAKEVIDRYYKVGNQIYYGFSTDGFFIGISVDKNNKIYEGKEMGNKLYNTNRVAKDIREVNKRLEKLGFDAIGPVVATDNKYYEELSKYVSVAIVADEIIKDKEILDMYKTKIKRLIGYVSNDKRD